MEEVNEINKSFDTKSSYSESHDSDDGKGIINPETNDIEYVYKEVENEGDYTPKTFKTHLTMEERIICVEMMNNNKIYIRYQDNWSIKDLIFKIVHSKEFSILYSNSITFMLDSDYIEGLFDLNLAVYRNIKNEIETKLDYSIQLGYLRSQGLLSNPKYPFLIFKDCKTRVPLPQNKQVLEKIVEEYEKNKELKLSYYYNSYLPRLNTIDYLGRSAEFSEFFNKSKKFINKISRITFDELIPDPDSQNWFVYDDESISYLLNSENSDFTTDENNIIIRSHSQIYLQDKQFCIEMFSKDQKQILISVMVNREYTTKIAVNLVSTLSEILNKINDKFKTFQPKCCFDINTKALKVLNYNDYIWEMEEPIGKYTYFIECLKSDKIPEYLVTDNPQQQGLDKKRLSASSKNILNIFKTSSVTEEKKSNAPHKTNMEFKITGNSAKNKKFLHVPIDLKKDKEKEKGIEKEKEILFKKTSSEKQDVVKDRIGKVYNLAQHIPKAYLDFLELRGARKKLLNFGEDLLLSKKPNRIKYKQNEIDKFENNLDGIIIENIKKTLENLNQRGSVVKIKIENEENDDDKITKRSRSKGVRSKKNSAYDNGKKSILQSVENFNFSTQEFSLNNIIKEVNSEINIANINRPFSIFFNYIRLNKMLNSSFEDKQDKLVLLINVQLNCGMQKFSKAHNIIWKGKASSLNIMINQTIPFGVSYSNLPMIISILFKVRCVKYGKKGEVIEKKTIFWGNFRLFDHLKRLQTGKRLV